VSEHAADWAAAGPGSAPQAKELEDAPMQCSSRVSRVIGILTLLLTVASVLFLPLRASAQDGNSSIELHDRICPVEYSGTSWFEDCHSNIPDPGLPFTFTNEDNGDVYNGTTNENGNVGFANLSEGTFTISGGAPGDFAQHVVYCAIGTEGASNQQQIPVQYVTTGIRFYLPAQTNVICDWFEIPYNLRGETPTPTQTPIVAPEQLDLPIFTLLCNADPGAAAADAFIMSGTIPQGCQRYAGASVTVSTPQGSAYGTCQTSATDACFVTVATGTMVIATVDVATIPADYTVIGGTSQQVQIAQNTSSWVLFIAVPSVQTPAPPTPTTAPLPQGRTLLIREGNCPPATSGDVVAELTDLRGPQATPGTSSGVILAESSSTILNTSLNDLLNGTYAVIAYSDSGSDTVVACTAIAGQLNDAGELVLGLKEVENSGYAGIVYMASRGNGSQVGVSVFLAVGLTSHSSVAATPAD
jgi:hypothetical protein